MFEIADRGEGCGKDSANRSDDLADQSDHIHVPFPLSVFVRKEVQTERNHLSLSPPGSFLKSTTPEGANRHLCILGFHAFAFPRYYYTPLDAFCQAVFDL